MERKGGEVGLNSTWVGRVSCFLFNMSIDGIEEIVVHKVVLGMG